MNESEKYLIGCTMVYPKEAYRIISSVPSEWMFLPMHRKIWETLQDLSTQGLPIDSTIICDHLPNVDILYLLDLINLVYTTTTIDYHIGKLRERFFLRYKTAQCALLQKETNMAVILNTLNEMQQRASEAVVRKAVKLDKVLETTIATARMKKAHPDKNYALKTRHTTLDEYIEFKPTRLYLMAARPAMGKSAFCIDLGIRFAQQNHNVLLITLEMSADDVGVRALANLTSIDSRHIERGVYSDREEDFIKAAESTMTSMPLFVDDEPEVKLNKLMSKIRQLVLQENIECVIIDYLQLLKGSERHKDRQEEISTISRAMKLIAKELNLVMIVLSQLNRAVESRNDKRPVLSDLRESGSLEQDADAVIFFYRDEYYLELANQPVPAELKGIMNLNIAKNRQGKTGLIYYRYMKKYSQFDEMKRKGS